MRSTTALAAGAIVLAAITGCAPSAPQVTPEPSSPVPTEQTSEATTPPAPTPFGPTPSASPSPSASGDDDARYCGDEYVLSVISGGPVGWEGTPEEQLQSAQPEGVFQPADAIDGLDVVCVVTYRIPTDGSPGVAVVSEAVLERDDDVFEELEAWATANGYESRTGQTGFVEREAPLNADGTSTMKIFWAPLDGDDPMIGNAADILRLSGADPDAVLVWHADFTQG
ncbi:hypothetical protein [Agrococcus sp. DT81.2]|uniref:hypothetical protein n=1 Tax=Agrococcus sp. DT81.2 TaxID=3393414 RepID=UPI003CE453D5